MATGSTVVNQLSATSAPTSGNGAICAISFGGTAVLQACKTFYIEVDLLDPANTDTPASFEVQLVGGINAISVNIGAAITMPGVYTIIADSPVTYWSADLVSLSGGVSPRVVVNGLAGE